MNIILSFVIIWTVIILCLLPIGLKFLKENALGHADSAPENPNLSLKISLSILISLLLTFLLKKYGFIG